MASNAKMPQAKDFFTSDGELSAAGVHYLGNIEGSAGALRILSSINGVTDDISGEIEFPADGTYTIILDSKLARVITELSTDCGAGSVTATPKIGSTTLGGGASSATTSKSTVSHSSDNAMAINDTLVLVLSSTSVDCEKFSFTFKYTRAIV